MGLPHWRCCRSEVLKLSGTEDHEIDITDVGDVSQVTSRGRDWLTAVAVVIFVVGVVLTGWRIQASYQTPGPFDPTRQGYCDFHNGVYFPALAFRQGVSPYSEAYVARYPVERSIPFYSPLILALHAPLTWLPLPVAEAVYFVISLGLLLCIAYLSVAWACRGAGFSMRWDWFWVAACALQLTRGGQQTLFTGYFTFELILAALVAVHYGQTRPWRSVLGLVLISAKPTYVLPIAGLMLFRGNFKAVAFAGMIALALALACFGWLAQSQSVSEMIADIQNSQEVHRGDAYELPVNTWTRLDLLAIVAKWTHWAPGDEMHLVWMIVLLIPPALVLAVYHRRNCDTGEVTGLSGAIVLLTSLIVVFHQVYDAMLMLPVIVALWIGCQTPWASLSRCSQRVIAFCLLLPALNYASSLMFLDRFRIDGIAKDVLTSLNSVGLFIACLMMLALAWKRCVRIRDVDLQNAAD